MTLLCPLVSIFSGRPQPENSPKDDAPAKAQVIITHAVAQAQLVRDYLSKSGDISTVSPLTGFSSFVSASTLLNAAKSWVSRTQPSDDASRNVLYKVSTIISETLNLLEVLQTYWVALRPMTQRLRQNVLSCPELSDSIQSSAETDGALNMLLAGANTPLDGEEAVQTTYVEDETQITANYAEEGVTRDEPHIQTTFQEANATNDIGFDYEDILHLPFGDAWDIDFMTLTATP
ncbi:hypothetical protein IL306_005743 [Fusarium sp. DS 682]|nr:hypothetical protein IL306_005743 [Fusarium sp. DS 682]